MPVKTMATCFGGSLALLLLASASPAAGPGPRSEQLKLDPKTGEFVEIAPPEPGTADGDLRLVRKAMAEGNYGRAKRGIKRWLKAYGESHALARQALILRAAIEIAREDYYKAHLHLQEFLDVYQVSVEATRALELEFIIAERFLSGTRRKIWGMRLLNATEKGLEILDAIANDYPGSTLAENAIKTKADYYFQSGDFTLAELEYSRLSEEFPRSRYARLSMRKSAESALASFPGIEFDDAALIEAQERFRLYLAQYPGSAEQEGVGQILQQIHSQRAAKEFLIGQYYERTKRLDSAIFYFRSTLNNWPETIAASQARERLAALGAGAEASEQPAAELTVLESTP